MSASAKMFLWNKNKDGEKPSVVTDVSGLSISLVDADTGEFTINGADVAVFYQHMFILTEGDKK